MLQWETCVVGEVGRAAWAVGEAAAGDVLAYGWTVAVSAAAGGASTVSGITKGGGTPRRSALSQGAGPPSTGRRADRGRGWPDPIRQQRRHQRAEAAAAQFFDLVAGEGGRYQSQRRAVPVRRGLRRANSRTPYRRCCARRAVTFENDGAGLHHDQACGTGYEPYSFNLISQPIQADFTCPVPSEKYSDFPKPQMTLIKSPSTHSRGVSRSSRTRGWMRWPQAALLTRALFLRTAKSCGPDASTPAPSLREAIFASDGDKKARSPGRVRHKP